MRNSREISIPEISSRKSNSRDLVRTEIFGVDWIQSTASPVTSRHRSSRSSTRKPSSKNHQVGRHRSSGIERAPDLINRDSACLVLRRNSRVSCATPGHAGSPQEAARCKLLDALHLRRTALTRLRYVNQQIPLPPARRPRTPAIPSRPIPFRRCPVPSIRSVRTGPVPLAPPNPVPPFRHWTSDLGLRACPVPSAPTAARGWVTDFVGHLL